MAIGPDFASWRQRVHERVRDRARAVSFARFLWRRFLDDNLFQAAAALAYTTAFALVPLAVVVLGVLSAFPAFRDLSGELVDYVTSNFVPSAARAINEHIAGLRNRTGQLTAAGIVALVVSLLVTLNSVEATFNRIWRVASARPRLSRYLVYWTVLTLGALLAAASLSVSARFFSMELFQSPQGQWLASLSLGMTPVLIELAVVVIAYRVVPHHTVKWRHAFAGAVLAVLLLEAIKSALGLYLGSFEGYQKLYGAMAFIPVLMLWIFLGWVAILLGASLASSLAAFRYQPASMRLPPGYEGYALLRLVGRFQQARRAGEGLHTEQMLALEPMLTDSLLQEFLTRLDAIRLVRRDEQGEWLLARDLDDLTLSELYEACQLRIPIDEAWLPCRDDPLGEAVHAVFDDLRLPLRDALKRRVGGIFPSPQDPTGA
ncbi:YihY family inner membrane protein [Pseudoxanthomonas sp. J35]|uniref:YihY family inner membrane protein n=1 Tax=Pseudoxanthomonas sp. J35 TaxID=935852 RepID=UPI0004AD15D0|nr:YihY family inner membrane protein [Pseudoxanthomonas sp. J35]